MATGTRRNSKIKQYHYKEEIASGATGATLAIPVLEPGRTVTLRMIAGSSTGKFQTTTSSDEEVAADTADWDDWDPGDKTGTVTDVVIGTVTGIRGVSVSGKIKVEVIY